jgi:nitrogen fixation/metabolism regulation signal transduction histidine kinase
MTEEGSNLTGETPLKPRRRAAPWLFGGLVLVLLTVLVALQLFGLWEIFTPETARDTLLLYTLSTLNFVAFFLFSFIFIRSLLKLRRERRASMLGSKIKTRLVVYFIAVSLLPITGMALFSYMFFNRSMEKFFSFFPGDVVRQARLAEDGDVRQQIEGLHEVAAGAASVLREATPEQAQAALPGLAAESGLAFALVISADWSVLARGGAAGESPDITPLIPLSLRPRLLAGEDFALELAEGNSLDVVSVPLGDGRRFVASRVRRGDASLRRLVASAQTFEDFRRNQRKVRVLGVTTLGLLTLMLLFAATWSAIHLARGIGTPIRALAEAAKRVAGGDLTHRVEAITDGELAVLADAFNDRTAQLAVNRSRRDANAAELGG